MRADAKTNPFVAGYVGRLEDWKKFLKLWRKELGNRRSLHLADMRLGSSSAIRKYGDSLRRLWGVPKQAHLHGFAGSVWTAPYAGKIKGSIAA